MVETLKMDVNYPKQLGFHFRCTHQNLHEYKDQCSEHNFHTPTEFDNDLGNYNCYFKL